MANEHERRNKTFLVKYLAVLLKYKRALQCAFIRIYLNTSCQLHALLPWLTVVSLDGIIDTELKAWKIVQENLTTSTEMLK